MVVPIAIGVVRIALLAGRFVPLLTTPSAISSYGKVYQLGRGPGGLIARKSISKLSGVPAGFVIGQALYPKRPYNPKVYNRKYTINSMPYSRYGRYYRRPSYGRSYRRTAYRRRSYGRRY